MNAPFRSLPQGNYPEFPDSSPRDRFPRLSPAQKILQAAADRAFWQQEVAALNLKPGVVLEFRTPDHPTGLEWGNGNGELR